MFSVTYCFYLINRSGLLHIKTNTIGQNTPDHSRQFIRQRSLDYSVIDTSPTDSEQDLEYIQVLDARMLLSLPQNHPLAEEENLDATQLANQQWIAVIHNDDVPSRDGFVETCIKAGFNHDICLEAGEPLTALGLVAAGLGLVLFQHSLHHNVPEGGYYANYRHEIFHAIMGRQA